MMLRNIFFKSLRDNRAGMLAWGAGLGLFMLAVSSQYAEVVGAPGAERARMAEEAARAFRAFSFLIGEITALDTIGGFITTRVLSFAPVLLGLWAAVVAVGLIRGEEQQGGLELLLSTPRSRISVFLEKLAALGVVIATAVAFVSLGLLVGIMMSGEPVDAGGLLLAMLNLAGLTFFWGAVGLLVGQLVLVRRTASSIVGGLLAATFLLNNVLEGLPTIRWTAWLLPFHYYSVSKPLVPGRSMDWAAWLALVALAVGLVIVSGLLFVRRDIGSTYKLLPSRASQKEANGGSRLLLGSLFGKSIRDLIGPSLGWAIGLGVFGIVMISTANEALEPLREMIRNMGWLAQLAGNLSTTEAYISFSLFTYLPVLVAVFAITQVEGWSSDEEEGRLELPATLPIPRWQLIAARYVALVVALAAILAAVGACLLLAAAVAGVSLDAGRLWAALAAAVPLGLAVAAFGLCVAAWLKRPGAALPITIAMVATMFFMELFAQLFGLPEAVLNLSVFHLYGRPLLEGVQWGGTAALIAAALVLVAGSIAGLNRRDIAK